MDDERGEAGPSDMEGIRFLCDPALEDQLAKPEPAGRFTPDWFRKMSRTLDMPMADGLPGLTVKACLPVTDAFSAGWIIPLSCEMVFEIGVDGTINIGQDPSFPFQQLAAHHPAQVGAPAAPFGQVVPLKWNLPWRIASPPGLSLLLTHPINHFELPFQVFSGLVDSDQFAAKVNAPFIWTGGAGRFTLPQGTPLAQILPVPRDALALKSVARSATPQEADEERLHTEEKYTVESVYARKYRARK